MTNRRNNSSMIFLTTLGVYLGLLLVGGSAPQVFAHSAMTRNFEIQDEIEVKDDLDNKPDDERTPLTVSLEVYLQDVEYFLAGLRKLNISGKFDAANDIFEVSQSTLLPCVPGNKVGSYTAVSFKTANDSLRPNLEWFSKRLTDGYSLADCLPSERFAGKEAASSNFKLKFDRGELTIQVSVKKASGETAKAFTRELDRTGRIFRTTAKTVTAQKLCESTSFRTENDQVFVVTRLARASIDPLLAIDAK
jgi:hypothetical protein